MKTVYLKYLILFYITVFSVVPLFSGRCYSQVHNVRFFGKVTDTGENALQNASVSIIYNDTEDTSTVFTNENGEYSITISLTTSVADDQENNIPQSFNLYQNYPNPFNPGTIIGFELPYPENVTISIYNITGQKIKTITDGHYQAGYNKVRWDGTNQSGVPVSAGIYFYRIKAGKYSEVKKMVLLDGGGTLGYSQASYIKGSGLKKPLYVGSLVTIEAKLSGYFRESVKDFLVSESDSEVKRDIILSKAEGIMFVRHINTSTGSKSQICTIKPDGSDMRIISESNSYEKYYQAKWSPDRSKIAIVWGSNTFEPYPLWLWVIDMDGNFLYKLPDNALYPVWHLSSDEVCYSRIRGPFSVISDIYKTNIYNIKEDTLILAEANNDSGYEYQLLDIHPVDEKRLLLNEAYYYSDSTGAKIGRDLEILFYDYVKNEKEYLTDNELNERTGRISPDWTKIVYFESSDLYLMSIDGNNKEQLTPVLGVYSTMYFDWSPDSRKIAFLGSVQPEGHGIYIIDITTREILRVTNTEVDYLVDWK